MGENQMIKACNFYVSQWHLFAALLPYVRDELKKKHKIMFVTQDNLEQGIKKLVAKLNLKFENIDYIHCSTITPSNPTCN